MLCNWLSLQLCFSSNDWAALRIVGFYWFTTELEKALKDRSSCRPVSFNNYVETESDKFAHSSNSSAGKCPKQTLARRGTLLIDIL